MHTMLNRLQSEADEERCESLELLRQALRLERAAERHTLAAIQKQRQASAYPRTQT